MSGTRRNRWSPPLDMSPDMDVGYIMGIVLGDGSLNATKSRDYCVSLETTREDYACLFASVLKARFPTLNALWSGRQKTRRFPNGSVTSSPTFIVTVNSKQLYNAIRPYKRKDFIWEVPAPILQSAKAVMGFLQGICDAEGSVDEGQPPTISISSKHQSNLLQIQNMFNMIGIKSNMMKSRSILKVSSRSNCICFKKKVGFRYPPKKTKLERITCLPYSSDIVQQVIALRETGLTYRAIAEKLNLKGTTVGSWVRGEAVPWFLKNKWMVS